MLDARIVKRRRDFTVDVALHAGDGDAVALFGPSGAGKSTVLSCIAGFERPDGGTIALGGRTLFPPPAPLRVREIGYLTQESALFPHLSVAANVRFGVGRAGDEPWIAELRDGLGLGTVWNATASRISGGQARQRAGERDVVRDLVRDLVRWRAERGFTLVVVDHQSDVLERLAPRVVVIENGRVVQAGAWEAVRAAARDLAFGAHLGARTH